MRFPEGASVVDVNCSVGRWPFHHQLSYTVDDLDRARRQAGIALCLVSSVAAILAPDPSYEEAQLHEQLAGREGLEHAPLICCSLPNWRAQLRRAKEEFGARMVKFLPTYRQQRADDPELVRAMREAHEMGMYVALMMRVEDERNQHPLMKVPAPTVDEVISLSKAANDVPVLVLNAYRTELADLARGSDRLTFDLALYEGADPIAAAIESVGVGRLAFGSHFPFTNLAAQVRKWMSCGVQIGDLSPAWSPLTRPNVGCLKT